jgi:hypothetical protein
MANSIFLGLTVQAQSVIVNGIATTSTDGLSIVNNTPATATTTVQRSPRLRFSGSAWNSVAVASETDDWTIEDRPVSVAGTTTSAIFFSRSIAGGAFTDLMNLNSGGTLLITHKLQISDATGELSIGASGFLYFNTRAQFESPADAQLNCENFAASLGVGLDFATDAVLKIRTRAQTGYATIDALGYKVSGVAGVATFGPSAVASITVVNGLITAIS